MDKQSPILVIGAGSIGERHMNNLLRLGYTNVHVLRRNNLPMRIVDPKAVHIHVSPDHIQAGDHVCAIICNPTAMHAESVTWCLQRGMHVLVEKPLSHTTEHLDEINSMATGSNLVVQVAYMMRYHPHLLTVEQIIQDKRMGELLHMNTYWGSYLPDWHPWEDHRTSYVALRSLGGGAALTLSHDLDIVNWLAQSPMSAYHKTYGYADFLQIETEAIADFTIAYANGVTASVHMNLIERTPRRQYRFLFEQGSITLDFFAATLTIEDQSGMRTHQIEGFDRNDLFVSELSDFLMRCDMHTDHSAFSSQQVAASRTIIDMCL